MAHFDLYQRKIKARPAGGSVDPPSRADYLWLRRSFGTETVALDRRRDGRLSQSTVTDVLDRSLAAVNTNVDPEMSARSLCMFAILQPIAGRPPQR